MANIFNIKITAVDNATKVVNKVNKSVAKIFAPYERAKQSAGSFLDAIGKNELVKRSDSTLRKLGGAIGRVGTSFGFAENSVVASSARIAASLAEYGGSLGVLAGGAVVVGGALTAVGVKMAMMSQDVQRTAQSIGVTTDQLQEYRGAAKLAGISTEAMDGALASVGTTMQDAFAGRNMQAAAALNQMGVSIKRNADGTVDAAQGYRDLLEVINRVADPNIQKKLADMFGIGDTLALIRRGPEELQKAITEAHRLGIVQTDQQIANNAKQADSWNNVKASVNGLGTTIGNMVGWYGALDALASRLNQVAKTVNGEGEKKKKADGFGDWLTSSPLEYEHWYTPFLPGSGGLGSKAPKSNMVSGKVTYPDDAPATSGQPTGQATGGQTLGISNNNPGNLRSWAGAGSNGGYASFPTAGDGLTAAAKNLLAYQDKYGINTINGIVNRWAPAADHNDVPSYVQDLSKNTGFGANQGLNLHDPAQLAPLLSSMVKHENGQNPFSADEIGKAVAQALKDNQANASVNLKVEGLPQGLSIKAVRGLGQVNTGLALAPGGAS